MYRLLLYLMPAEFRARYGNDMATLFVDRQREAGRRWRRRAEVWTRGTADLINHGFAERFPRRPRNNGSPRRRTSIMERLLTDTRHALRGLAKSPGFTAAAMLTLALGIGVNIAIFSAVNAVLLQPLPYPQPDRLVRVWPQMNFSKALTRRVAEATPTLEAVSGMSGWLFTLTGEGDPQQVYGVLVSWNHLDLLGVQPQLGRNFTPQDAVPGQADVVILSHGLWTNVFGADPDIIGRRIRLAAGDYQTRRVIGVMPPGFRDIDPGFRLWAPLDDPALPLRDDNSWYVNIVLGRLADGATVEQTETQVRTAAAALHEEWPERIEDEVTRAATVEGLQEYQVRDLRATLWTLFAAVGAVLLIACANVANLLLARGNARRHELAMRTALGATRGRLMAQLLTEGTIIGLGGGLCGVVFAWLGVRVLVTTLPEELYQVAEASIDPTALAFASLVSVAAVIVFAVLPAWRAAANGSDLGATRSVTTSHGRLSGALVVAEVALSLVLVLGAGLMLRSLWNLYREDVGFDPHGVLSFRINIPDGRIEDAALPSHYERIWEAIGAVPGVEKVGGIHLLPMSGGNWSFPYVAEGHPVPEGTPPSNANHRVVTPSYFDTMGIPLLRGRFFNERDTASAESVGLINERMAQALWPDADPVGKRITVFGATFTVVGVVADIRQHGLHSEVHEEMYRPFGQWPTAGMFALVRTSGDPRALLPSVQHAIWDVDPDAPLALVRSMDEVFGESVATDRFVSLLISAFAALALALGTVGVYGVTAYTVGGRMREFGVRMAIGADRSRVLRQALLEGLKPALLGVAVGLAGAWWATRLLNGMLYDVGVYDTATFVTVPAVLAAVAVLACALPAWRASRLDPVIVLRQD
jgi:putative ABC transport system permease protein